MARMAMLRVDEDGMPWSTLNTSAPTKRFRVVREATDARYGIVLVNERGWTIEEFDGVHKAHLGKKGWYFRKGQEL